MRGMATLVASSRRGPSDVIAITKPDHLLSYFISMICSASRPCELRGFPRVFLRFGEWGESSKGTGFRSAVGKGLCSIPSGQARFVTPLSSAPGRAILFDPYRVPCKG